jgi:hypothetical protein
MMESLKKGLIEKTTVKQEKPRGENTEGGANNANLYPHKAKEKTKLNNGKKATIA